MADVFADGNVRVAAVATIANRAAPTVAELTAGLLLQTQITADGLIGFEATTAEVDTTSLASTFDTKGIGRDSFSGTMLRCKKQTVGADTVKSALTRGTATHIVIRRGVAETTAWAAGQEIQVHPVIVGRRRDLAPEANSVLRYEIPTMVTEPPEMDAVVAA